jgi:hypothetical protein
MNARIKAALAFLLWSAIGVIIAAIFIAMYVAAL